MRLFRVREHPLRHRLWLAGSWTGLVVATFVVSQVIWRVSDASPRLTLGGDFVPAYAAGKLVREGRAGEIYHIEVLARVEQEVVAAANLEPLPFYGPYLNPPWFAMVYAPLAGLPYRVAAGVWLGINLLCVAGAMALMIRMLRGAPCETGFQSVRAKFQFQKACDSDRLNSDSPRHGLEARVTGWRTWGLVPLLIVISMPFWQALGHLQNTCVSLLLVCGIVTCWRGWDGERGKVLAGVLCGLLFYKPQLACVLAAVMSVGLGWRAVAGCVSMVTGLVVATAVQLPGTLTSYFHSLGGAVTLIQSRPEYNWGRQVTPRGFWRLLIQGHGGGAEMMWVTVLAWGVMLGAGSLLGVCVWRSMGRREDPRAVDRMIAATICAMPLLMPYYMDYDLLLLAVPATLIAVEGCGAGFQACTRRLGSLHHNSARRAVWAWGAMFMALYVNPGLSGQTRVNLAAPLVAIVGGATMIWCARCAIESPVAGNQNEAALAMAA